MKRVSDFPLISALVIKAKTSAYPPMTITQAMEATHIPIPKDLVHRFVECEKFLGNQLTEDQVTSFYERILQGLIKLPEKHEITMSYAAGSARIFSTR